MTEPLRVREPFSEAGQQHEADMLGMYLFLATEIMLFGGLFAAIAVVRTLHPEAFVDASRRTHFYLGGLNTIILLTSSAAVALAVVAARKGTARRAAVRLAAAALLGLGFLALKALEYARESAEHLLPLPGAPTRFSGPAEQLFMNPYLIATGLYAVHVAIGVMLLAGLALRIASGRFSLRERAVTVELCGLYWHLVDVIWVFLYPALYLAR